MTNDKLPTAQDPGTTEKASATSTESNVSPTTRPSYAPGAGDSESRSGKVLVVAVAALVAAVVAYFAFGMPGMDHGTDGGSSMAGMDMSSSTGRHRVVSPDEFDAMLAADTTLINVHIPNEGEIEGTDLTMPYNALDVAKLPAQTSAKLLVYCMTGNMSAQAATALLDLGYTDVVELDGGMQAWTSSGRQILKGR